MIYIYLYIRKYRSITHRLIKHLDNAAFWVFTFLINSIYYYYSSIINIKNSTAEIIEKTTKKHMHKNSRKNQK